MSHRLILTALAILSAAAQLRAGGIEGQYLEARTCDVWTGPCFANAEMNWGGKHAVMAWKVGKGTFDNVRLDGLSVVAVISAHDTLGLDQTGTSKAIVIVDNKASPAQKEALVHLAQRQGGDLLRKVIKIEYAKVALEVGQMDPDDPLRAERLRELRELTELSNSPRSELNKLIHKKLGELAN